MKHRRSIKAIERKAIELNLEKDGKQVKLRFNNFTKEEAEKAAKKIFF